MPPGANGNIVLEGVVARRRTVTCQAFGGSTELQNELLYADLKFSFLRDTTPVASINRAPLGCRLNAVVRHSK